MIKLLFEKLLVLSKSFIYLPVIFGIISALVLFIAATVDMCSLLKQIYIAIKNLYYPETLHADIVSKIIGAVDLYLIAVVLLIFSFGLYELFISKISAPESKVKLPPILAINSLDELKDKLAKVIVMVLVVGFFQRVLYINFNGALEMMYFAFSISALSIGVYLLHKDVKIKKTSSV
jgi:uncharacterized membrane protein YqhA